METFIHIDGDNIGNHIELLLMDGKLADAQVLSRKIQKAFDSIKENLQLELDAVIHIFAGDDLILTTKKSNVREIINNICGMFYINTGLTLSVGVGNSIESALLNLRRAKISGRNKIVGLDHE